MQEESALAVQALEDREAEGGRIGLSDHRWD